MYAGEESGPDSSLFLFSLFLFSLLPFPHLSFSLAIFLSCYLPLLLSSSLVVVLQYFLYCTFFPGNGLFKSGKVYIDISYKI